jgi:hypothetical protein
LAHALVGMEPSSEEAPLPASFDPGRFA